MSSELLSNFTIDKLKSREVNILSVFDDKLLISCHYNSRLFFYSLDGHHLSSLKINDNDELWDAIWTPRGNITYSTCSNKVAVISKSGEVISLTQMTEPRFFSVSNDGIIYVADKKRGVYQSKDDGVNWELVFKPADGWQCWQVIKVTTDHSDDFWTLEEKGSNWHLRVYSVDSRRPDDLLTWRYITLPTIKGKCVDLSLSKLSYDGKASIFLNDYDHKAVHVLSRNGQYHHQLLSPDCISNEPWLAVVERQLLYLGQEDSILGVFKLLYGERYD